MSKHTIVVIWSFLLTLLVCGCDPVGLRRIQLELRSRDSAEGSGIAVNSPDVQQALKILEPILIRHGFQAADVKDNDVWVYVFDYPPASVNGQIYTRHTQCRVQLIPSGLFITFGHLGFLAGDEEALTLFADVRSALIRKYGKKNVRSHEFPIHHSVAPE